MTDEENEVASVNDPEEQTRASVTSVINAVSSSHTRAVYIDDLPFLNADLKVLPPH